MSQVDDRQSTHGWPRVIMIALAIGAAIFAWRGVIAITADFVAGEYLRGTLTAIAVISWVAGSAGLIHNGRRMRYVAWASWTINAVMPVALFFVADDVVARVSPWFSGGATYFYVSTVGAIVSLAWLAWSAPSQIAARNGG